MFIRSRAKLGTGMGLKHCFCMTLPGLARSKKLILLSVWSQADDTLNYSVPCLPLSHLSFWSFFADCLLLCFAYCNNGTFFPILYP